MIAEITFPDSGRTLKIERVSFITLSMLRAHYARAYEGKPIEPVNPIENWDSDTTSDEFKALQAEYAKAKEKYEADLTLWQTRASQAQWLASKLIYAKGVQDVDMDAIEKAIAEVAPYMNLKQEILDAYKELNVPFEMRYMNQYIYLWHVCITNGAEQNLFTSEMTSGSGAAQEAVQTALFRLRSQI